MTIECCRLHNNCMSLRSLQCLSPVHTFLCLASQPPSDPEHRQVWKMDGGINGLNDNFSPFLLYLGRWRNPKNFFSRVCAHLLDMICSWFGAILGNSLDYIMLRIVLKQPRTIRTFHSTRCRSVQVNTDYLMMVPYSKTIIP